MSLPDSDSDSSGCSREDDLCSSTSTGRQQYKEELVTVYTLRDNDVLFGRGSGPNGFSGNVRYRNLIRSILIKACNMIADDEDEDASINRDLDFFLPDSNDRSISIARRNRILATQVVKAIKSRKGRFLQRVSNSTPLSSSSSSSSSSQGKPSGVDTSNLIERIMYKEVEESIAIEKTKQNFRDQMRQLQAEQPGVNVTTGTKRNECCEDSWGLLPSSRHPSTLSSSTSGKRVRTNEDYPLPIESFVNVNKVTTRFLAPPGMSSQKIMAIPYEDDFVANRSCLTLPRTTVNSLNLLSRGSSLPYASLYQKDDMIMERVLSQHAIPLSHLGSDPIRDVVSYRHLPIAMQQPFIPEVRSIRYNSARPPLEHHLRMKSNLVMHAQEGFVEKDDLHYSSNAVLSLGGQSRHRDDMLSHRMIATISSRPTTTLSMTPIMSSSNRSLPSLMALAPVASSTTERVEAMIASHQTRRDRFWMGWAKASKK